MPGGSYRPLENSLDLLEEKDKLRTGAFSVAQNGLFKQISWSPFVDICVANAWHSEQFSSNFNMPMSHLWILLKCGF